MYTPIIGTLGYVLSADGMRTLLVHRNARSVDEHFGKYNGLGGKMLREEDVVTCMKRELHEESGLTCTALQLRGTINWTGFGPQGEDWLGFIFLITGYEGTVRSRNEEGDLDWHLLSDLYRLPMWEGDRHFLPLVFDGDPHVFHGCMPYNDGRPIGWSFSRI